MGVLETGDDTRGGRAQLVKGPASAPRFLKTAPGVFHLWASTITILGS
jgi:hypothetical protein